MLTIASRECPGVPTQRAAAARPTPVKSAVLSARRAARCDVTRTVVSADSVHLKVISVTQGTLDIGGSALTPRGLRSEVVHDRREQQSPARAPRWAVERDRSLATLRRRDTGPGSVISSSNWRRALIVLTHRGCMLCREDVRVAEWTRPARRRAGGGVRAAMCCGVRFPAARRIGSRLLLVLSHVVMSATSVTVISERPAGSPPPSLLLACKARGHLFGCSF
ncbi:unnamed protein product [Chrysodeixis includens]|uniref:Uncharacterized protein n=1 Tax=Chrysodeixis includens TaxID=689277 RepID=A0A9N8L3L0_CHRIL|nr:unnamed protein product [Chrysodeixis includens]